MSTSSSSTSSGCQVKRQITVRTRVTDDFRLKAQDELTEEIRLIEEQLQTLDTQYQQSLRQLEQFARQGQNVTRQVEQLQSDAQSQQTQLNTVKMEVSNQLANLGQVANGATVITGVLESWESLAVGDRIFEKLRQGEILVEDGVIVSIS